MKIKMPLCLKCSVFDQSYILAMTYRTETQVEMKNMKQKLRTIQTGTKKMYVKNH